MKIGDLVRLTRAGEDYTVPENVRLLITPCLVLRAVKSGDVSRDSYGDPNMLLWELLTGEGTCVYWPVNYTRTNTNNHFFKVISK